jgi:hypothetical protein
MDIRYLTLQHLSQFTQIWIFGLKIHHLATLVGLIIRSKRKGESALICPVATERFSTNRRRHESLKHIYLKKTDDSLPKKQSRRVSIDRPFDTTYENMD